MYEVTTQELMIFVALGFGLGVFTSFYLARLLELVHMWKLLETLVINILFMCLTIVEDIGFVKELKRSKLKESNFTPQQIDEFEKVDALAFANWKESLIQSILNSVPRPFKTMMPFGDWASAMKYLQNSIKRVAQEEREE